jgi:small GTP-binding protein
MGNDIIQLSPILQSVVILGLDNAGKTTLVNQWTKGVAENTTATIGLNVEHVNIGGEDINLIDLGGQEAFRLTLWKTYAQMANAVIFIFDITDHTRAELAAEWFWRIEAWIKEDIPIAFLANKIDLKDDPEKNTMELEEIIKTFRLDQFATPLSNQHSFWIFEISAKTGDKVDEALNWLFTKVNKRKKEIPELRQVIIASRESGTILNLQLSEEVIIQDEEQNQIKTIIDMNSQLMKNDQTTVQIYELQNISVFLLVRNNFLCAVSAKKGCETDSLQLVGESILSLFLAHSEEESIDKSFLEKVIKQNFSYKKGKITQ